MNHLQRAVDAIEQPAFVAGAGGAILLCNALLLDFLGCTASGVDGAWADSLQSSDSEWPAWRDGVAAQASFQGRISTAEGPRSYSASPVFADGSGARWLVCLTGKPNLKPSFEGDSLRLGLSAAMRATGLALWEWNRETDEAYWSPELYDLLRLPRGSGREVGERFLGMIHPDDASAMRQEVDSLDSRGGIEPVPFRIIAGDGSVRWLVSSGLTPDGPQKPTRVVGVNIDVTETLEAEQHLKRAQSDGQRQSKIMEAVMEHVPIGLAVQINGRDDMSYVSKFGVDMMNRAPANGRLWDAWQVYHLDGKTPALKEEMALFRASQGEEIRNEEWFIRASDGSLVPVSANAGPIKGADGGVIGGIVAWYDVTPFKDAERQRDLFLAAVSHELRTPLSAMLGWSAVLNKAKDNRDLLEKGIAAIERNVRTEARLIDDLLDASRISAGTFSLSFAKHDLRSIVQAAVETVEPVANGKRVTLDLASDAASSLVPILGDEMRLRQAVWNLLANAVKFSPEGGLVQVTLSVSEGACDVAVKDYGAGIDPTDLERVFERFWQHSNSPNGRGGGLGLGLSIARHIVKAHGGSLKASSDGVGLGSTFTLTIPLAPDTGQAV